MFPPMPTPTDAVPMPPTAPLLAVEGVQRRFGALVALAGVDLVVERGEVVLLAGPNGAGKSTLLRCVAGLARPTRGRVHVAGCDVHRELAARAGIGLLSHHALLYDDLTARENLRFAATLHGLDNAEERIATALAAAELTQRADTRVGAFSRGMLQRLAIARAVLHAPALLLLDEPFTGLDLPAANALRQRVAELAGTGHGIVCVTHEPGELWDVATRVVILHRGRVVHDAPRADALDRFRAAYLGLIAA